MAEWKKVKLGDIISFDNGKKRPTCNGEIPVYGGNGILAYSNISNFNNCVIIGRVGAYCGCVFYERNNCWVSDNAIAAKNNENSNIQYCYYLLKSLNLNKRHIGTSQPLLTQEILNNIDIQLPSLQEQKQIAGILSSFDDKIELNNQINHNLEEQAKAIFKSWFVDFEPFGGKMPEEWREGTLKDLLEIRYGKDHKKLADGQIPVYGSGGLMRYAEKALYQGESVLIPRKGTLNNVMRISGAFWTVDTMFYSIPKKKGAIKYAYHILSVLDLATMNSGSAVPSMTTEILNSLKVILPTEQVLLAFDDLTEKFWETHELNRKENQQLAQLRDTLLPKLMSGEIDVSEVEV